MRWALAVILLAIPIAPISAQPREIHDHRIPNTAPPRDLASLLEPIRAKYKLPALAGIILDGDRIEAIGATGVRRAGSPEPVTTDDLWHLGSCTKAMTATLCAILVERGTLTWSTTVGNTFPDLAPAMDPAWRTVTLEQLLTHRAGAPADLNEGGLWGRLWQRRGTPTDQRLELVTGVTARPPVSSPGTAFLYSNAGYAIAGAMAERATGTAWEDLITRELFTPLGITTAGFGAPGEPSAITQPRGHKAGIPIEPGPQADNPPAIGPGGTAHMTITDWSKFIGLHLRGQRGESTLLPALAFKKLQTPAAPDASGDGYAMGWGVTHRDWGGQVLTHAGSNTLWFCVTWVAPDRDFAVLVTCNQGGAEAAKATDEACQALGESHQASQSTTPATGPAPK